MSEAKVIDLRDFKAAKADRDWLEWKAKLEPVIERLALGRQRVPNGARVTFSIPVRVRSLAEDLGKVMPFMPTESIEADASVRDYVYRAAAQAMITFGEQPSAIVLGRISWLQFCIAMDDYRPHKHLDGVPILLDPTREHWIQALPPAHLALAPEATIPIVTRGGAV